MHDSILFLHSPVQQPNAADRAYAKRQANKRGDEHDLQEVDDYPLKTELDATICGGDPGEEHIE